jgi:hypothetical protein
MTRHLMASTTTSDEDDASSWTDFDDADAPFMTELGEKLEISPGPVVTFTLTTDEMAQFEALVQEGKLPGPSEVTVTMEEVSA